MAKKTFKRSRKLYRKINKEKRKTKRKTKKKIKKKRKTQKGGMFSCAARKRSRKTDAKKAAAEAARLREEEATRLREEEAARLRAEEAKKEEQRIQQLVTESAKRVAAQKERERDNAGLGSMGRGGGRRLCYYQ